MSVDGLLLRACLDEIRGAAVGARVERVHQPRPDTLTVTLYRPGEGSLTLLAGCSPRHGRLHLTDRRLENPPSPPAFCMLLRKHLQGRRLLAVEQQGFDRVALLRFGFPGGGDPAAFPPHICLVVELAGAAANAILVDPEGVILDAMRRRTGGRPLLPGAPYRPLERGDRLDLPDLDSEALAHRLDRAGEDPLWRALLGQVEGPGPDVWRDVAIRAGVDPRLAWHELTGESRRRLLKEVQRLADGVRRGRWTPCAVVTGQRYRAAAAVPIEALSGSLGGTLVTFRRPSELCDAVFGAWQDRDVLDDRRRSLESVVQRELGRAERRLEARRDDLTRAGEAARLRKYGELLLAQLHRVPRGRVRVVLPDVFDEALPQVEIALDPALTPAANAQRYFDRARKLERAQGKASQLLRQANEEVRHLREMLVAVEQADDPATLEEVAAELREYGYAAPAAARRTPDRGGQAGRRARGGAPGNRGDRGGRPRTEPMRLVSRDGWTILVGRNNRQNDRLTFRLAAPGDWWFHVKDEPGAHVIARPPGGGPAGQLPPATLEDAALAAAYYSAARGGQNVPVDYTQRRRVRKPQGARPGFVVYDGHRTVFVTPDAEAVQRLAAAAGARATDGAGAGVGLTGPAGRAARE
ncbi:MAG TPA: NFACT RNA binding domain-containing protein [Bacillota bacterium]